MVRIINYFTLFSALVLLLGACSNQATDEPIDAVNNMTRSLVVSVPTGSSLPADMGIFIDNATYPGQSVENIQLKKKENRYESTQPLSWGGTDAHIGLSAYAPYMPEATADEMLFSVKLNQKAEADYVNSDLMLGVEAEAVFGQGMLQLALAHKMVKLIVVINDIGVLAPDNYSVENLTLFGFYTAIPFSPKLGKLGSDYLLKEPIVPFSITNRNYEALAVPQSAVGYRHIEFDVRNKTTGTVKRFFSAASSFSAEGSVLESGKAYKMIIEADFATMHPNSRSATRQATPTEVSCQVIPCAWNSIANK